MTFTTGTGALWLDVTVIGLCVAFLPLLVGVVLLTRPGTSLNPAESMFLIWSAGIGAAVITLGLLVGRRTRWKIPDPRIAKTK